MTKTDCLQQYVHVLMDMQLDILLHMNKKTNY